jgi:hypothetical protein
MAPSLNLSTPYPLVANVRSMYTAFGKYHSSFSMPSILTRPVARSFVLAGLQQAVETGYLEIEESGRVYKFGSCQDAASCVRVTVRNDSFWSQMLL